MDILIYSPEEQRQRWVAGFAAALPEARVRAWAPGERGHADYLILWRPTADVLRHRRGLKAVFNLGAGVDAVLALLAQEPGLLPPEVPLVRLDDAGMGAQMVEYVTHATLRYFRRFDAYDRQQAQGVWQPLAPYPREQFAIGLLGLGTLGAQVATALARFGFPVRGWSRTAKTLAGVSCFAGAAGLGDFLAGTRVLVNLLPLTADTAGLLDRRVFDRLARGAYLINVARGEHLAEDDLLAALRSGQLAGATLDVCRTEPLPAGHPFWHTPGLTLTPHISALTLHEETIEQISRNIRAMERGEPLAGVVDRQRGY